MKISTTSQHDERPKADALLIPCIMGNNRVECLELPSNLKKAIKQPLDHGDFLGKLGEFFLLYTEKQPEKRIILVGLGKQEDLNAESLRRAYGKTGLMCRQKKLAGLNILVPKLQGLDASVVAGSILEGISSVNYTFDQLKSKSLENEPTFYLENLCFTGVDKEVEAHLKQIQVIFDGVYIARDLANGNADDITPQYLGELAQEISKEFKSVKTTIFDKKRLEKEGMGLLLAVGQGSHVEPSMIIMEYKGDPKGKNTVYIGKGVTYDTGGLNLKPTGYMETMKSDMSGAATGFGIMYAVASLKLKLNLVVVIPTTENSISATSFKPGDVYVGYNGISVEIGNTDAEGRLILADAIAYAAEKYNPSCIIDMATLTGAIDVALGPEACGAMGNNVSLINELIQAGEATNERVWHMPLFKEYREQLDSDIADIKNVGTRSGGACTAAKFLEEFVNQTPWVHCDIAGLAYLSKPKNHYIPKHATGFGVRLFLNFLMNREKHAL
ncbi:MAG: leucyl aminopeptidase [Chlamydiales bacterium]